MQPPALHDFASAALRLSNASSSPLTERKVKGKDSARDISNSLHGIAHAIYRCLTTVAHSHHPSQWSLQLTFAFWIRSNGIMLKLCFLPLWSWCITLQRCPMLNGAWVTFITSTGSGDFLFDVWTCDNGVSALQWLSQSNRLSKLRAVMLHTDRRFYTSSTAVTLKRHSLKKNSSRNHCGSIPKQQLQFLDGITFIPISIYTLCSSSLVKECHNAIHWSLLLFRLHFIAAT